MTTRKNTRCREVRTSARIYAHELAAAVGITEERLRRIEYGRSLPTTDEAAAIENALGREVGSIFGPEDITPKRWHRPAAEVRP